ncbi:hypothetical protein JCM8115_000968 [Rhodotorula mucilaginosa]
MFNTFDYINPSIHAAARRYSVGVCGAGVAKTTRRTSQLLSPDEEQIKTIYSALTISDLWKRLGDALGGIEAKPDLLYLSTVLLPLIESLLVVNKFTDASSTEFIDFTPAHSKILNTMVRNNPLLMSGSFAVLVRNSSMLNFENKRSFFFSVSCTPARPVAAAQPHYPTINLNVRRARVFEDLYHVFLRETGDEIKYGKLNGKFYDEQGVDAGGVTREWFGVLARQMFNPGYALCQPQAADPLTYQPNKASALVWILDNYTDCIINLTFSVEGDEFGVTDVVDLIPNGRNGPVTNKTRHDYVHRIAVERLSFGIRV